MSELLHPGVYVEETSFRAKAIEGVATFALGILIGVAVSRALLRFCRWSADRGG